MKAFYLRLFFSCLFTNLILIQINAKTVIRINHDFESINALPYVEYKFGGTFQSVSSEEKWKTPKEKNQFTIPVSTKAWLHCTVVNVDSLDRYLEFFFHSITITHAKIYVVVGNKIDSSCQTGNLLPLKSRASKQRDLSLPFAIKAGQRIDIYLSIYRRGFTERISLNLADARFGDGAYWQELLIFMLLGLCMLIFSISLSAFFSIKDWVYFFYALYVSGGILFLACSFGYAAFIFSSMPWLFETAPVFFVSITLSGFIYFSIQILKIRLKFWRKFLLYSPIFSIGTMIAGIFFTTGLISAKAYIAACILAAIYALTSLGCIMVTTLYLVIFKREKIFGWFLAVFASLIVLVVIHLLFESNLINPLPTVIHLTKVFFVTMEILLTTIFLINYTKQLLDEQTQRAIRASLEKEEQTQRAIRASLEKEEQRNEYSDVLHNMIKSRLEIITFDLNSRVKRKIIIQQMEDLIKTCYLLEEAITDESEDILSILNNLAFNADPVLHKEEQEKYFYRELSDSLNEIKLTSKQKLALVFLLSEAINNVKKYSNYQNVKLTAVETIDDNDRYIEVCLEDDGVGLHSTIDTNAHYLEISSENLEDFINNHLKKKGSTGIRRMFGLASRMNSKMIISSQEGQGTKLSLIFGIQDGGIV